MYVNLDRQCCLLFSVLSVASSVRVVFSDSRFVTVQRYQLALQIIVVLVLGGGRLRLRR